ncbi:hypothetical protein P152DRAFT_482305 [Eremomyces bilateralis CBS 781.70]|uniref:Uncharacterized protein n=1 Tax=Eremomyces bilateralis CBS 781.70 TaxID=1392243 RepID=A0A6G1G2W5_9PEZI|nr:uncharacterized protein P152DRAFT_482305 [Eremomyces bilateralis CBS 781.70]KAF1812271.1 hypothetical protein P152DRAFT_482305 [Eremomyces bilateralis CBS 781.70]
MLRCSPSEITLTIADVNLTRQRMMAHQTRPGTSPNSSERLEEELRIWRRNGIVGSGRDPGFVQPRHALQVDGEAPSFPPLPTLLDFDPAESSQGEGAHSESRRTRSSGSHSESYLEASDISPGAQTARPITDSSEQATDVLRECVDLLSASISTQLSLNAVEESVRVTAANVPSFSIATSGNELPPMAAGLPASTRPDKANYVRRGNQISFSYVTEEDNNCDAVFQSLNPITGTPSLEIGVDRPSSSRSSVEAVYHSFDQSPSESIVDLSDNNGEARSPKSSNAKCSTLEPPEQDVHSGLSSAPLSTSLQIGRGPSPGPNSTELRKLHLEPGQPSQPFLAANRPHVLDLTSPTWSSRAHLTVERPADAIPRSNPSASREISEQYPSTSRPLRHPTSPLVIPASSRRLSQTHASPPNASTSTTVLHTPQNSTPRTPSATRAINVTEPHLEAPPRRRTRRHRTQSERYHQSNHDPRRSAATSAHIHPEAAIPPIPPWPRRHYFIPDRPSDSQAGAYLLPPSLQIGVPIIPARRPMRRNQENVSEVDDQALREEARSVAARNEGGAVLNVTPPHEGRLEGEFRRRFQGA